MGDIIVITILAIITGLIIFSSIKNKNKGGCAGCSKCNSSQCASGCGHCDISK